MRKPRGGIASKFPAIALSLLLSGHAFAESCRDNPDTTGAGYINNKAEVTNQADEENLDMMSTLMSCAMLAIDTNPTKVFNGCGCKDNVKTICRVKKTGTGIKYFAPNDSAAVPFCMAFAPLLLF